MNATGVGLKGRHLTILRGIARGMHNAEIAQEMYLSVETVRHYVKEIYQIIGVRNRTEAAVYALKSGLVSLEEL